MGKLVGSWQARNCQTRWNPTRDNCSDLGFQCSKSAVDLIQWLTLKATYRPSQGVSRKQGQKS